MTPRTMATFTVRSTGACARLKPSWTMLPAAQGSTARSARAGARARTRLACLVPPRGRRGGLSCWRSATRPSHSARPDSSQCTLCIANDLLHPRSLISRSADTRWSVSIKHGSRLASLRPLDALYRFTAHTTPLPSPPHALNSIDSTPLILPFPNSRCVFLLRVVVCGAAYLAVGCASTSASRGPHQDHEHPPLTELASQIGGGREGHTHSARAQ